MIEDFDPDAPSVETTWARARSDYAAGESASAVCERYRLNRSTFFARAKAEGWRRSDDSATKGPDPYVAEMEAALVFELMGRDATPAYTLSRRAWAMAEIALLQRRRIEAASWVRIARDLRKLAMEETGAHTWRRAAQLGEEARPQQRKAGETISTPPVEASPAVQAFPEEHFEKEAGGEGAAALSPEALAPTIAPEVVAPETKAAQRPATPDWGPLPMSTLVSPRKLNAFLHGEFAEAWAASDSSDRSGRTADSANPPAAQ